MHMREPFGATPVSEGPEPARAQSASGAASTGDTTSSDAARMERAIDQFIQRDRDDRPKSDAGAFDALARHGETGIVARLAPRRRNDPERLPRIVTSSLPIRPLPLPGDDRLRRQFIGALRNADDSMPMMCATPPPLPPYARTAPSGSRRDLPEHDPAQQGSDNFYERSTFAARWRTAGRGIAAAVAITSVFSIGALWATHRSVMVAELGGQPAQSVALQPAAMADSDATPDQQIRNTPVLIREGETLARAPTSAATVRRQAPAAGPSTASASASASIVSRIVNVGEPPRAATLAPLAPVVRVVPVVPIVPASPIVPSEPIASAAPNDPAAQIDAAAQIVPDAPIASVAPLSSQPPLDRDGLTERAARPDEKPPITRKRPHDARPARTASVGRVSGQPSRSQRPAIARSQVPVDGWAMRRQGLRSEPQPEPSTLKKLIGLVWPPGKPSTAAEPSKPAVPAVTKPVLPWSDSVRANP
jgi:hypothetical protein